MSNLQKYIDQLLEQEKTLEKNLDMADVNVNSAEEVFMARKAQRDTLKKDLEDLKAEIAEVQEFAKSKEKKQTKTPAKKEAETVTE